MDRLNWKTAEVYLESVVFPSSVYLVSTVTMTVT